ncbi:MAG: hypothetical protein Q9169_008294, partial [Polycauliona sp. 2 TL-2023]
MDPLSSIAITVSACAFGLDVLLLYRQMHIAPWDQLPPDTDPEAAQKEPLLAPSSNPDGQPHTNKESEISESSPILDTETSRYYDSQ